MFRTVSQIAIHYRGQPLSAGSAGAVDGRRSAALGGAGRRQPGTTDNYAVLDGRALAGARVRRAGRRHRRGLPERCDLPLHVVRLAAAMAKAGLTRNALYLVRPDGYVALADPGPSAAPLIA